MSPTPDNPLDSVIRGQEYFRLKQVVQSPGDIYELNESTRAVYIGPDSDIAEARITYYNPSEPLGLETADVSVNGPFVGRVDALLATQVPSTGQPARILVSPVDIVNNAYVRPSVFGTAPLRRFNIEAQIDLICALKTLPSIPQTRADKTLRFPNVPFGTDTPPDQSTDIVIPIYGRRMITCQFVAPIHTGFFVYFYLVALQPGQDTRGKEIGSFIQIDSADVTTNTVVIKASDSREGTAVVPNGPPLPEVKGLADLLVLNIGSYPPGPFAPGTDFIDCFIKLTDRET
jgi:hypothetical protein